jgi:hypothetical protein
MAKYASETSVSVHRSREEIERTLMRYGATSFAYLSSADRASIAFEARGRRIVFNLPMPAKDRREFTHHSRGPRTQEAALAAWEQACRQRWRALALAIKAKLEAVDVGITTFEDEFLAHIMLPNGDTVGSWMKPQIALAYERREMPPMLPAPRDGGNQ